MSTLTTICEVYHRKPCEKHKLNIDIYKEMYQPSDTVCVSLECSTCYCTYEFLISEHLGQQLAQIIQKGVQAMMHEDKEAWVNARLSWEDYLK